MKEAFLAVCAEPAAIVLADGTIEHANPSFSTEFNRSRPVFGISLLKFAPTFDLMALALNITMDSPTTITCSSAEHVYHVRSRAVLMPTGACFVLSFSRASTILQRNLDEPAPIATTVTDAAEAVFMGFECNLPEPPASGSAMGRQLQDPPDPNANPDAGEAAAERAAGGSASAEAIGGSAAEGRGMVASNFGSAWDNNWLDSTTHTIRTCIGGILGMTQLLASTNTTTEQETYSNEIRTSTEALANSVSDIIDRWELVAGKVACIARPIPSHPIPSHGIPSHPIPSHGIPSHPIPSHGIASHPIPSHGIASHPIPSAGIPSDSIHRILTRCRIPFQSHLILAHACPAPTIQPRPAPPHCAPSHLHPTRSAPVQIKH